MHDSTVVSIVYYRCVLVIILILVIYYRIPPYGHFDLWFSSLLVFINIIILIATIVL
jgi:hypothetical protein